MASAPRATCHGVTITHSVQSSSHTTRPHHSAMNRPFPAPHAQKTTQKHTPCSRADPDPASRALAHPPPPASDVSTGPGPQRNTPPPPPPPPGSHQSPRPQRQPPRAAPGPRHGSRLPPSRHQPTRGSRARGRAQPPRAKSGAPRGNSRCRGPSWRAAAGGGGRGPGRVGGGSGRGGGGGGRGRSGEQTRDKVAPVRGATPGVPRLWAAPRPAHGWAGQTGGGEARGKRALALLAGSPCRLGWGRVLNLMCFIIFSTSGSGWTGTPSPAVLLSCDR